MPVELIVPAEGETEESITPRLRRAIKGCREHPLWPACGVILVRLRRADETPLRMGYLWSETGGVGMWNWFGDPATVEEPRLFGSASSLLASWGRAVRDPDWVSLPAVWLHPDAGNPADKHLLTTGARFPGCPRR